MKKIVRLALVVAWALCTSHGVLAQKESEHYEKGVQAHAEGEYAEAYIHLKNALQVDPDMVPARLLMARVHFNAGNIAGAAKESEEALLLGADINLVLPVYGTALVLLERTDDLFELEKLAGEFTPQNRFEWALLKGQGYLQRSQPDRAREEFEKAARMFPDDVRSNNTLAAVYMHSGMREEAARLVDKSLLLDPDNVKTLELQAELAIAEGDVDKALSTLERAYEMDSEDLRVLRGLARVHLLQDNQDQLEHYLDLILEQSPDDPAATLLQAIVMVNRGGAQMGDAMLSDLSLKLSELDALTQSSDEMLFIQASADYLRGSDRSAIDLLNTYLARNPADLAAIRMLVDLYLRNSEDRLANELLSDSREYVLEDLGLSLQLLQLYIENGSVLLARELLEELRGRSDNDPYITILEAELERSLGKSAEALALLDERDFGGDPPLAAQLLRGALLLDLSRLNRAGALARDLQAAHGDNLRVQNYAAVTYLRRGDLDAAGSAIDAALEIAPSDIEARFNRGMLLKQRGQLEESATLLDTILADRPGHIKSIMLMARILFQQQQYEKALDWSEKVYTYDRVSTLPDALQLDVYKQTGDLDKAVSAAVQLTKAEPLNDAHLVELAELYIEGQDYDLAQRPLRRLFALWQNDPARLRRLAGMQLRANSAGEARQTLEKALELAPGSVDTQLALVRLDIAQGNYDRAAGRLDVLRDKVGQGAELSFLHGEIAMARGEKTQAQAQFMQAFELDPNHTAAVARLYELSLEGVGGEAFTDALETQLRESSLPAWKVRLLADSHLIQGNTQRARRYYESLLEHPELGRDPAVLNNLANIYAKSDLDKALATAMQALEGNGEESPALLDTVGWILTQQGREEEALPYLRKAHAIDSRDPEIRYHTGVALLALGREKEAAVELRAALDNGGGFDGRAQAQRLLDSLAE